MDEIRTRTVRTSDGIDLAVFEQGPAEADTVVLVHGYPDNHTVWDGVAALLAEDHHVVRYDVRGHGASQSPASTAGYGLPQLSADLRSVIEATSPDRPVHLVAHDWGSIQSWESVLDPAFEPLLRSYTSISGPSLDAAAVWLRRAPFHIRDGLKQLAASYYVFAFQLPRLPEAAVRSGVLDKAVNHSANIGITDPERRVRGRRPERDLISGLELYRSNFVRRMLRPRLQVSQVPTQVLAPTDDAHVTVALQTQAPVPYVSDYRWEEIPGNHWVVEHEPAMIAEKIRAFID